MTQHMTNCIKTEQRRIQRLIDLSRINEDCGALGSLSFEERRGHTYCYQSVYDNGKRVEKRYLGKPNSDAVRRFCSLKYRRELQKRLYRNKALLEKIESSYVNCDPASVYSSLPATCHRASFEAYVDERYEQIKSWAKDYQKNTMPFTGSSNFAKNGIRVRSKGECLVYNLLLERGIPFRYDSLFTITDDTGYRKTVSPDFLVQCYDGALVIIEHLGMLSSKKYALDYGEKCHFYMLAGFVPGKNFLVTSDNADGGIDSAAVEAVVSRVEELFWGY